MDNKLSLGVSCKVITPAVGCQLYGYRPDIMSNAVNDDLTVTAFYFKQNETQALMISATVCLINSDLSDEILSEISSRYGIPKQNCLLHATHTHSGPDLQSSMPVITRYLEKLNKEWLPQVAKDAMADRMDAELSYGSTETENLNFIKHYYILRKNFLLQKCRQLTFLIKRQVISNQ